MNVVRVSGNKVSNDTTNDNLNHPIDTVLFAFDNYKLDQSSSSYFAASNRAPSRK